MIINFKRHLIVQPTPKRYVVGYIAYQHAAKGTDDYEGWQDFYKSEVFIDKQAALYRLKELNEDRFAKKAFLAEEVEVLGETKK